MPVLQSREGLLMLVRFDADNEETAPLLYRVLPDYTLCPVQMVERNGSVMIQLSQNTEVLYGSTEEAGGYYVYDEEMGMQLIYSSDQKAVVTKKEPRLRKQVLLLVGVCALRGLVLYVATCHRTGKTNNAYFQPHLLCRRMENRTNNGRIA